MMIKKLGVVAVAVAVVVAMAFLVQHRLTSEGPESRPTTVHADPEAGPTDSTERRGSSVLPSDATLPDQASTRKQASTAPVHSNQNRESIGGTDASTRPLRLTEVQFDLDRTPPTVEGSWVLLARTDGAVGETLRLDSSGVSASALIEPGDYLAAVHVEGLGLGAVVRFSVEIDPVAVKLSAPYAFDLELQVRDGDTDSPIEGARLTIERADLELTWKQPSVEPAYSDAGGRVQLARLTPGLWHITATADGYVKEETTFGYPGRQEKKAREHGRVELRAFYLPVLRPVVFQLVNHQSWDDLTEFSVALTDTGDPVAFSADGRATLPLGWHALPLYVKIEYPGRRSSTRYLDGGLPQPGEVHSIDIGGPQELEVDLQITPEMIEALDGSTPFMGVSFRASNEDATKLGVDVDGPTTILFRSVQANHVVISLETTETGSPIKWKSKRVAMKPEGRTSCTLLVDTPPTNLRIISEGGTPVAGFHCEIRQIPDDTSWVVGGMSSKDGLVSAVRITQGRCCLCGSLESERLVAIDVPLDLALPGEIIDFPVYPSAPTYVEIGSALGPVSGIAVELLGADTAFPYHTDRTGTDGRIEEIQLVTRSRAKVRLNLETRWTPTPEFDLQPGRNAVTVYDTGQLRVTSAARLGDILSLDFDTTLAEWVNAGQIGVETTQGGALLCRVPVGSYEVTVGTAEPRRVDVRVGAIAPSGI